MGKGEEDEGAAASAGDEAQRVQQNVGCSVARVCGRLKRGVNFRCVFTLLFGVAVFVAILFWLPFFHYGDRKDLDLDSEFGAHAVVASFMVQKPASFLEDYVSRLQDDIFEEISFPTTKVQILKLESLDESNATKVVFAVDSDATTRSLIKGSFVSLLIHQYPLRLTSSMFGDPFAFEVLKFFGGISVSPQQSAFLMQKVLLIFQFTLNFSIEQIQNNFDELRRQLKSGLHLAPYENLYVTLLNSKGSTVAPPSTVQCKVLLAFGINPSSSRINQLAQRITGSHAENLGLNNSVFGRVKQVSLSSVGAHSPGGSGSPSPAPSPQPHHHHHHHRHHHPPDTDYSPTISPAPQNAKSGSMAGKSSPQAAPLSAPTPAHHKAKSRGCHFPGNGNQHSPISPPILPPQSSPSPPQSLHPPRTAVPPVSASSPLPNVVFAHVRPPSERESGAEPPDSTYSITPSPSSSSARITSCNLWAIPTFLYLMLHV